MIVKSFQGSVQIHSFLHSLSIGLPWLEVCVGICVLLFLPVRILSMVLRRTRPGATVISALGGDLVRKDLSSGGFAMEKSARGSLPGFTFSVTGGPEGIEFWSGLFPPRAFVHIPWESVTSLSVTRVEIMTSSGNGIELHVERDGMPGKVSFAPLSPYTLGLYPMTQRQIQSRLEKILAASRIKPGRDG